MGKMALLAKVLEGVAAAVLAEIKGVALEERVVRLPAAMHVMERTRRTMAAAAVVQAYTLHPVLTPRDMETAAAAIKVLYMFA